MNSILQFDFIVDKKNNTIQVVKEFAADVNLVWAAWTEADILDQWWAPEPWVAKTKSMDFREGGHWFYAMVGTENEKHWAKVDYISINPQKSFTAFDGFSDSEGNLNTAFPRNKWENTFEEQGSHTLVHVQLTFDTLNDLETIIQMGFKEGFTAGLANLDQYIAAQFYLRKQKKPNNKARVSSYLNFPGNTEEVFHFYKKVFKSEFVNGIQKFSDIPAEQLQTPVAEEIKDMVLYVELPILGGHILMGTDAPQEMGFNLNQGNNLHICLEPESREEAKRLFDELSEGGNITMPLEDMFFGAYFGEFSDKYGINWMVNYQEK